MESDPNGVPAHAPGSKLDNGKTQVWLCISGFANALEHVAQTTTVGATKYSPSGWEKVHDGPARYMEAFGRHMLKLGSGEEIDKPTGLRHKAQMAWNILASLELELRAETPRAEVAAPAQLEQAVVNPGPAALQLYDQVQARKRWEATERILTAAGFSGQQLLRRIEQEAKQ